MTPDMNPTDALQTHLSALNLTTSTTSGTWNNNPNNVTSIFPGGIAPYPNQPALGHGSTCPWCGRCPHCGQPYPSYPQQPIVWTSTAGASGIGNIPVTPTECSNE